MIKNICSYCKKVLQPIGNKRKNGKLHNDWNTRKLHKKCFKIIIHEKNIKMIENLINNK
jgi:hypothetical protein